MKPKYILQTTLLILFGLAMIVVGSLLSDNTIIRIICTMLGATIVVASILRSWLDAD